MGTFRGLTSGIAAALLSASVAVAQEPAPPPPQDYEFLAAPQTDLNRMFRVEKTTGEIGVCQYAVKDGSVGVTLCLAPGEGAGPQEPGSYGLAASSHTQEGGVYRVERRTGRMSACYVLGEQVVCTPQAR
ncbi:hypothetical protein [Chenggangzhangella methanolivorans]|uniref:Secreted protein n=1 Tax=Chenggangzhangella methanolivorans TaxID=1437009 RepID=A0A9E6ULR8_9HYPH|nr:hypothetical protein [Chenggangzhangella methanolivorans]QZO00857.1 hypothetical protein K6K41_04140 [Chenggangzhangella methanolivorans]